MTTLKDIEFTSHGVTFAVPAAAEATARRAGKRATVKHYPIGHFDIYLGEWFERSIKDQIDFLQAAFAVKRSGADSESIYART